VKFDLDNLAAADRYELLLGTVVPRPIALVTTLAHNGAVNAAPYSLFNVASYDPPIIMISVLPHREGRLKDTATNIFATKEFVVGLVSETLAEAMNITCIDAPPGANELQLARLETAPSTRVGPPRVAASPVSFECRFVTSVSFGTNQTVIFGQVLEVYVADEFVSSVERCLVDTPRLKLIGGMHGARWYTNLSDRFEMKRPTWDEWLKQGKAHP
jgi:flavin reductase (DIM6/NTAB) family NADH-FMN oxidoreductase RutF